MKKLKFILFALVFTSCGTVVNYDYEKSTDFAQYKTYNYFDDMQTGLSGLDNKRLMRAIDSKLESMGYTRTDNASFYIDIQSQDIQNRNNSNVGVGVEVLEEMLVAESLLDYLWAETNTLESWLLSSWMSIITTVCLASCE